MPPAEALLGPSWLPVWLALVALGGLLAMDGVSWPQVMVSRPTVSATIGGLLAGDAAAGLLVGALLEILMLRHPPFGAARYPDGGPAGLVGGVAFGLAGEGSPAALAAALAAGWAVGWAGSGSVQLLRKGNEWLVGSPDRLAGSLHRLERRHRAGIQLDALRGALITAGFLVPAVLAVRLATLAPEPAAPSWPAAAALGIGLAVAVGAASRTVPTRGRSWALLTLGLVAGAAGALTLS